MGYPGGPSAHDPQAWDQTQPNFQPPPAATPPPPGLSGGWSFQPVAQPAVAHSDKSRVTAGVLQLIGVLGVVGLGRAYLGYVAIAIAQFIGALFAGAAMSIVLGPEWLVPAGPAIVGLIDGALILTGRIPDSRDRQLRD